MKLTHPKRKTEIDVPASTARVLRRRGWVDVGEVSTPARSATKSEWVAHAVAQGADPDEAEASTKDALIAAYGD